MNVLPVCILVPVRPEDSIRSMELELQMFMESIWALGFQPKFSARALNP